MRIAREGALRTEQVTTSGSLASSWQRRPQVTLIALTLLPRLAVLAGSLRRATPFGAPGHDGYLQIAQNLIATGTLGLDPNHLLNRGPVLPLLLSPGVLLGHPEIWSACLHLLASVGTCLLVYAAAMKLTGSVTGSVAAAALVTLDPWLIWFVKTPMTPVTATFFAALAIYFFAELLTGHRPMMAAAGMGVACALAAMDHPGMVALLGGLTLAIFAAVYGPLSRLSETQFSLRTAFLSVCVLWAFFFVTVLPYSIRNYRDSGRFVLITESAGLTYLMGTSHYDLSHYPWGNLHWPFEAVANPLHVSVDDLDVQYFTITDRYYPELNRLAAIDFRDVVLHRPVYLAERTAVMSLWFFFGDYSIARTLAHCVFLAIVFAAWWAGWRRWGFLAIAPFLAMIVPGTVLHSLTMSLNGHAAYSIPYIVPMALPLAFAFATAREKVPALSESTQPASQDSRQLCAFE